MKISLVDVAWVSNHPKKVNDHVNFQVLGLELSIKRVKQKRNAIDECLLVRLRGRCVKESFIARNSFHYLIYPFGHSFIAGSCRFMLVETLGFTMAEGECKPLQAVVGFPLILVKHAVDFSLIKAKGYSIWFESN